MIYNMTRYLCIISLASIVCFFLQSQAESIGAVGNIANNQDKSSNQTKDVDYSRNNISFNFIALGDWGCEDSTSMNMENIIKKDPDFLLGLGDYSYDEDIECWKQIIEKFNPTKVHIAIGNHELESEALLNQYMEYFNLKNPYYSFDYKNIHFLAMSTESPYTEGSKQYEFIMKDLSIANKNPLIDWIVVFYHKPMYTSESKHEGLGSLRDEFHKIFDKFNVDLVLQGHQHNYQRTYPLVYNTNDPTSPRVSSGSNIVLDQNKYYDNEGPIFIISGTGGKKLYELKEESYFVDTQFKEYGFVEIGIDGSGNKLVGKFYNLEDQIRDEFTIEKIRR